MEKNMNSWECDKLFASEASGPQKNLKMGLGGNLKFCGYGRMMQLFVTHFRRILVGNNSESAEIIALKFYTTF